MIRRRLVVLGITVQGGYIPGFGNRSLVEAIARKNKYDVDAWGFFGSAGMDPGVFLAEEQCAIQPRITNRQLVTRRVL